MAALEIYLVPKVLSKFYLWVKNPKQYSLVWSKTWTRSELVFFSPIITEWNKSWIGRCLKSGSVFQSLIYKPLVYANYLFGLGLFATC